MLRSSAGAVAVLFGVLFVPTLLAALLPSSWQDTAGRYLPMNAGDAIYTVRPEAHMLENFGRREHLTVTWRTAGAEARTTARQEDLHAERGRPPAPVPADRRDPREDQ